MGRGYQEGFEDTMNHRLLRISRAITERVQSLFIRRSSTVRVIVLPRKARRKKRGTKIQQGLDDTAKI